MKIRENEESVKRLNTKGCCFLCLRIENVSGTDVEDFNQVAKCCSMRHLLRHLQIKANSINKSSNSSAKLEGQLIEVNLCEQCIEINDKVGSICQTLEKLHLELNYMLECIHSRVTDSAKDSDLVQEYSRRMTSDLEALSELAFVDNLRKDLAIKCLKMRNGRIPVIQITKFKEEYKRAFIKQEQPLCENESDGEINCAPPPSPSSSSLSDNADSEPSLSSPTPEEMKFDVNPPPEELEQKPPPPMPSSSSTKHTLDVTFSSATESTSKNNLPKKKQTRVYTRRLPKDIYSKNETTGMFHCKTCSESYKSLSGVRWHYQTAHLHWKPKCKICEKLVTPSHIWKHEKACRISTERRLANQDDPKLKFICNQCGRKFETRKKHYDHEFFVHRNANRYPCKLCDKKFKQSRYLKIHVDGVHLRKRFSCRFCNKSYAASHKMREHEKKCTKKSKIKDEPEVN